MIKFKITGSFDKSQKFFKKNKSQKKIFETIIKKHAENGLSKLKIATPSDTGKTASMWSYEILDNKIIYTNANVNNGVPIVILLQYGHATNNGGYVAANDFINPTLQPIFDKIAIDYWTEVTEK